ncbi:Fur family transcriptional regulator [Marinilabilia rubra]|uniref:Transcriptional repressor n=1 Tax=Marinilabilia rubra TaxID=2162893 RepID=A0A2U2BEK3_9BACT|nr:transcriptional repressor [Marinilabilia rubra]PWE01447.1 transcriptional repressor [Marinilabilia rubra]
MVAFMEDVVAYIKSFGLSGTLIRKQIISCLWGDGIALTQKEIEERLPGETDRVTLYRTLRLFTEKGVIHKIVIDEDTRKYKLAGSFRKSDHAHFHCIKCNKLLCMPQLNVDLNGLPAGFRYQSAKLVVEGICDFCSQKQM